MEYTRWSDSGRVHGVNRANPVAHLGYQGGGGAGPALVRRLLFREDTGHETGMQIVALGVTSDPAQGFRGPGERRHVD